MWARITEGQDDGFVLESETGLHIVINLFMHVASQPSRELQWQNIHWLIKTYFVAFRSEFHA